MTAFAVMPHQTVCLLPPSVLQTRRLTLAVSGHLRRDTRRTATGNRAPLQIGDVRKRCYGV